MEKISNVNLKVLEWDKEMNNSRLELNLKRKNLNYVVMNTLRRTILSDVPIYAFDKITINKNTSAYLNNNYMKLRIENLPVIGIENNNVFYEEKIEEEDEDERYV